MRVSAACPAGKYSNDLSVCTDCAAGTYAESVAVTSCTKCLAGQYSNATGQTTVSTCKNCPLNSNSIAGSYAADRCQCNVGFTGPGGEVCTACELGTYKISTGSGPCIFCELGKFSTSTTSCAGCVAGTYSDTAGTPSAARCTGKISLHSQLRELTCAHAKERERQRSKRQKGSSFLLEIVCKGVGDRERERKICVVTHGQIGRESESSQREKTSVQESQFPPKCTEQNGI